MLAPVLARLEAIAGVAAARTDASGRFFWLSVEDNADAAGVAALARGVLGDGSRALSPADAEAQLAAHARGDPWLAAAEVLALSFVESRLLSVRLAADAARLVSASEDERDAVAEAIRGELFAVMERVHAEGGRSSSGWIYQAWPAIAAAALARCAQRLPAELHRRLAELLPRLLAR